jgi:hypothetical protein
MALSKMGKGRPMKFLPVALLLAGCAPTVYQRPPGATAEQYERTLARCRADAALFAAMAGPAIQECMRAEGYIKR